ncbi:hypothetical protein LTR85_002694 [Meristemomyces frigidus]|nr:hypothetical protein LTR85_002694 [Meristemomyces frigidus]
MTWVYYASPEVDAASHYPAIIAVSVTFCVPMLSVVTTRGFLRTRVLGWDDVVIFITAGISVVYTTMCIVQTRRGLGLPLALRPAECKHTQKMVRKSFDSSVPGYCLPFPPVQYPMAVISILCDIVVFLLPVPLFRKLSLSKSAVLGLCVLFGCGLITTVCSIVRATYLKDVGPKGNGNNTMVVLMGCVEANVGIIMSCLPFLKTLLTGIFKRPGRSILGYRSTKRSHPSKTDNLSYSMDVYSAANARVHITATGEKRRPTSLNGSEEAILPPSSGLAQSKGILKTTQVHVGVE